MNAKVKNHDMGGIKRKINFLFNVKISGKEAVSIDITLFEEKAAIDSADEGINFRKKGRFADRQLKVLF